MSGQIAGMIKEELTCRRSLKILWLRHQSFLRKGHVMSKLAFIFPGQGAQKAGMGKDFYENSEAARSFLTTHKKFLTLI